VHAIGLALLMLGLAVGTLHLLWNFVVERRPLETWFATYGVGVVLSLPRLRDSLPNAPPLGTVYDYLVYYWALAVTAIALPLMYCGPGSRAPSAAVRGSPSKGMAMGPLRCGALW
jgi:hypothetical protein